MRSAIEIIMSTIGIIPTVKLSAKEMDCWVEAIHTGQKEAIEECAERATTTIIFRPIGQCYEEVDKESILSIINELK